MQVPPGELCFYLHFGFGWHIGENFDNEIYELELVKFNDEGKIVSIIDNLPPNFKPIEVKITIESLDELKDLWARFNIDTKTIEEYNRECIHGRNYTRNSVFVFGEVNDFVEENYPDIKK